MDKSRLCINKRSATSNLDYQSFAFDLIFRQEEILFTSTQKGDPAIVQLLLEDERIRMMMLKIVFPECVLEYQLGVCFINENLTKKFIKF